MQRQSVEPNDIRYSSAISTWEKGAQPEQALELLREMQRQSVEPIVISYCSEARLTAPQELRFAGVVGC